MLFYEGERPQIRHTRPAIAWLRVLLSVAWLSSAFIGKDAKLSPAFLNGSGLIERIHTTFVHTALTPQIAHLLATIVVPHAALVAVAIGVADTAIGLSLLAGVFTRLGASLAIVRSLLNIAVAAGLGADTVGFNVLLIGGAALCIATGAGRQWGVDRSLVERAPRSAPLRLVA